MYFFSVLSIFLFTLIFGIPIIVFAPFPWARSVRQRNVIWWSRCVLRVLGVKVEVWGVERLRPGGLYLFVANHQSNLDIPALMGYLPVSFRIVAKKSLFAIPVFGWCMSCLGFIAIERENPRSALRSLQEALDTLTGGMALLLFAEGTRSLTGELQTFKPGAFYLAQRSRLPIVPVSIAGGYRLMPRDSLRARPGTMYVVVGAPLAPEEYADLKRGALMERVREEIRRGLEEAERRGAAETRIG